MKANIAARLTALEAKSKETDRVTLHMADGTVHTISGSIKHWRDLFQAQSERDHAKQHGEPLQPNPLYHELDWLRDAVRIDEYAHMFELLHALEL